MLFSNFKQNFGTKLNELLMRTGMSKRELARRMNVSNATISRWVSGDITNIWSAYLFELCDIFEVDPLYFCKM